jgi:hypothetical protein
MKLWKKNLSVQIETNRNPKNEKEKQIRKILKKLHAQRKIWQPHGRLFFCWSFYYVNDNIEIDIENTQIMHCILCYQEPIIIINWKTQTRKD